ncbi:MAG: hypothetical protein HYZ91_01235 [Candidatus Omnitrophica bacterium]|nr:hypothetical protein [Candidatus Omnitrophota bacterium]
MVIRVRARWWLFLALILAIALNGGAAAEPNDSAAAEASVQQVSLESLVRDALRRSPGLQAKKRAYEAARGRVIAAWLPDDPEVSVDVEGQPDVFRFSKRSDREYTVMQTIPFPTKLLLRAQIAAREAQMVYQRYKEEERSVAWHIEQPYYELYMTKKTHRAGEGGPCALRRGATGASLGGPLLSPAEPVAGDALPPR